MLEKLTKSFSIPVPKELGEFGILSSPRVALHIWNHLMSRYLPAPENMSADDYVRKTAEELDIGEAFVGTRLDGWSKRCHWDQCLCSFSFSIPPRPQSQLMDDVQKPGQIRVPHRMKVCTGCWRVWYCGRHCQERYVCMCGLE